jgi:energy-coupling factor transport system ATP-binding protein
MAWLFADLGAHSPYLLLEKMIKITDLSFKYPNNERLILDGINLEIHPGSLILLTGASGSGKSTLLRTINGLVPHYSGGAISGEISIFGHDPIKEGPQGLCKVVSFVFQEPEKQFVYDIVEDEIAFVLENLAVPYEEMQKQMNAALSHLDIDTIRHQHLHETSGGEQQKVAIASALITKPRVLILDEPTSQLDPRSATELLDYIVKLKTTLDLTILIAEHRLERLLPYCDKIIHLFPDGKALFGTPQEVLSVIDIVPPIIQIAKQLELEPLPFKLEDFPQQEIPATLMRSQNKSRKPVGQQQTTVLELKNVCTNFGEQEILKNISFELSKGEFLVIHGPNGSGKTTLIRSILKLIPSTGEISLMGKDLKKANLMDVIEQIGYLPQNPNDLLFADTVLDELIITIKNHGYTIADEDLIHFLDQFGLAKYQDTYPRDLSVGERQRTALAAITVHKPPIIILDEPTRGMDYSSKIELGNVLKKWQTANHAICLVTHDVEFAAQFADRVMILNQGEKIFDGDPVSAYTSQPGYHTQTSLIFPSTRWILPKDIPEGFFANRTP